MWNLVGLLLILFVVSKGRRFDGENTAFYFLWYGMGRFWIEGLRTDSLYLFDWTFLGSPIRVSQVVSLALVALGAAMLVYNIAIRKCTADGLYVNQLAAEAELAEMAAAAEADETAQDAAIPEETAQSIETKTEEVPHGSAD